MAPKSKKTEPSQAAQDTLAEMHKEGFANLTDLNTAVLESFGDMSAQMAKFIAQRIEEDVKVQHELLHCTSLKDVQHIQMHFFEQAFKQYQEGAARMMDIGAHALQDRSGK